VDSTMPDLKNNADFFGEQYIVDKTGQFLRFEERLLATSSKLGFHEIWQIVTRLGGLFIPAHVNRKTNGLFSNLGMIPMDTKIEALDISRHITVDEARKKYPQLIGYPLIQTGDVHMLGDMLGATHFIFDVPTIAEIKMALEGINGRRVFITP